MGSKFIYLKQNPLQLGNMTSCTYLYLPVASNLPASTLAYQSLPAPTFTYLYLPGASWSHLRPVFIELIRIMIKFKYFIWKLNSGC